MDPRAFFPTLALLIASSLAACSDDAGSRDLDADTPGADGSLSGADGGDAGVGADSSSSADGGPLDDAACRGDELLLCEEILVDIEGHVSVPNGPPDLAKRRLKYDECGRHTITSEEGPNGKAAWVYRYEDGDRKLTTEIDRGADGSIEITRIEKFDEAGTLIEQDTADTAGPQGTRREVQTFDASGDLIRYRADEGQDGSWESDSSYVRRDDGRFISFDTGVERASFIYDAQGRLTIEEHDIPAEGGTEPDGVVDRKISYSYEGKNQEWYESRSEDFVQGRWVVAEFSEQKLDAKGLPVSRRAYQLPGGQKELRSSSEFTRDGAGRVVEETRDSDGDGVLDEVIKNDYVGEMLVRSESTYGQRTTIREWRYDANDRLTDYSEKTNGTVSQSSTFRQECPK